jgi:hypothetical protein
MFPFVIAGRYLATVKCTGAEVAVRPTLSDATAVSVCKPSAKVNAAVEKLYGLVEILRSNTSPSKNWTLVTLPAVSLAEAPMVTLAVLPKTEFSAGLVIVTLSGGV